jgi:hypothetical protein
MTSTLIQLDYFLLKEHYDANDRRLYRVIEPHELLKDIREHATSEGLDYRRLNYICNNFEMVRLLVTINSLHSSVF